MKNHKAQTRRWFGGLAGLTLLILLPFAWSGYLRPAMELTKVVSITDDGGVLDVPESFSVSVDAFVESALAKYQRGGENVRVVLLRSRDRLLCGGTLLIAGILLLLVVEFLALEKSTRRRIPTIGW